MQIALQLTVQKQNETANQHDHFSPFVAQSHIAHGEERFPVDRMQLAADEARQGHGKLAQEIKELVDSAKTESYARAGLGSSHTRSAEGRARRPPSAGYPDIRPADMALSRPLRQRLDRILAEQPQQAYLQ
ncbi:hypothetical protein HFO17_35660 [Rhizobium laguerreae]|uniref:hypothetical protein n=1 Tax=Rhizobium laguerreae TaxID=1076926 RepID=UPI001C90ADA3|nr:hypothetical protein [Rhizobium laguerreae]MBY3239780.1 hypothetical protein [Rhizobium laguerreae]